MWAHRQPTGIWSTEEAISGGTICLSPVLNPVPEQATMLIDVQELTAIDVSVFDVTGRLVRQFPTKVYPEGNHSLVLGNYQPGVYFCVASTEEFTAKTCFAVIE